MLLLLQGGDAQQCNATQESSKTLRVFCSQVDAAVDAHRLKLKRSNSLSLRHSSRRAAHRAAQAHGYDALPPTMRPNAWDHAGRTALHHALLAIWDLVADGDGAPNKLDDPALKNAAAVARLLLERVARPASADVFSGNPKAEICSGGGPPQDALAILVDCCASLRDDPDAARDETDATAGVAPGREETARSLDDLLAFMFECGFSLSPESVRVASRRHFLERARYLYVEHCRRPADLKRVLERRTDVFLKRREPKKSDDALEAPARRGTRLQEFLLSAARSGRAPRGSSAEAESRCRADIPRRDESLRLPRG